MYDILDTADDAAAAATAATKARGKIDLFRADADIAEATRLFSSFLTMFSDFTLVFLHQSLCFRFH